MPHSSNDAPLFLASLRAQATAQIRALRHLLKVAVSEKSFATAVISLFLMIYAISAHILVGRGLDYVRHVPLLGPILTERMMFLLFFFFFVMLVLSNATITGIGLFRRQETSWLLTLPIPHESLVLWRTVEGLMLSSWGLMLLSAPILAAFASVFGAGWTFYLHSLPAVLCLISIAANISTWLLLIVVNFYRPWWLKVAVSGAIIAAITITVQLGQAQSPKVASGDVAMNVKQILRHTQLCTHPLLPSSWVAEASIAAAKGLSGQAWFFNAALLSYALVAWLVTAKIAKRFFYPSWNRIWTRSESSGATKRETNTLASAAFFLSRTPLRHCIHHSTIALIAKDVRTFFREPMQWGQCVLIFSLLLLYTWNLRNLGYTTADPLWSAVISHLNLLVCSLATSTLTTRFIFPQFSLEGQRFWILGMAPVPPTNVLRQKFLLNLIGSAPLTITLVTVSCFSLRLPGHRLFYFTTAMLLLSLGLTSMALALGALLPNFRETNSAKIVSGFGGTLCLVLSFLFIVGGMLIVMMPAIWERAPLKTPPMDQVMAWEHMALLSLSMLTLVFGGVPYWLAKKRIKELAYSGYM
jgi:ABC-2 type transport system permease protein